MNSGSNRKLSTIVFTDIAGYSAMMSRNESRALKMLEFHDRIAGEIFTGHHGQIIKKMGDGLLAVFHSVKDALGAAKMLQEEIKTYNEEHPDQERLLVRVGIHAGDVVEKDGDIFGNEVNVAARLEQICIPGGICLSHAAQSALGRSNSKELIPVGEVPLKNIDEQYTVFMHPSVYPDEFKPGDVSVPDGAKKSFVISEMKRISPEKFSLIDSMLISLAIIVLLDFGVANLIINLSDITLNEAILALSSSVWFLICNLLAIIAFTITFLRDCVNIRFEDVRDTDQLISFIIQRFGFRPPERRNGQLVFRPSVYNLVMWSSQKMRVAINGNHMTISGSYLFLRKVKKMLKAWENQGE